MMDKINISKRLNYKLLLLLFVQAALFILYQYLNKAYQTWDSAGHIGLSFIMANQLKDFFADPSFVGLTRFIKISNYYPPFVQMLGAVFSLLFGYSSRNILLVSLVFFIVAIIYTYKIAFLLSKNESTAFYTALIFSFFPEVLEQARLFHLDIPLVALVLMAIYYLLVSDFFSKRSATLLFFLFAGLAQVTKWYGIVYLAIPVLLTIVLLIQKVLSKKTDLKTPLTNLIFGAVIYFLICFPWYYLNFADLIKYSKIFSTGESDDPVGFLSVANLTFYPNLILIYQTLFLPGIVLLMGVITLLVKNKKQFILLALYLLVSPLVFLLIANKNLRYVLPLTPLLAYFIAYFLTNLPKKFEWLKYLTAGYLIFGAMFISFNTFRAHDKLLLPIAYVLEGHNYRAFYDNPSFYAYDPKEYPVEQLLTYIYKDANKFGKNPLGIGNLSDSQKLSAATVEMVRLEKHMSNVYIPVPYFRFKPFASDVEMDDYFTNSGSEYVIAPAIVGPSGLRNYAALTQLSEYLRSGRNTNFTKINTFSFPDGNVVDIFKRNGVEQRFVTSGECTDKAGFLDGIETIKLVPDNTYIIFTGHFAIQDKVFRNYEQGVLYVLQIENKIHTSLLDIHNMPKSGSSLCVRPYLGLDVSDEITKPLVEKNHCGDGVDCKKVIHVFWRVGEAEPILTEFKREDYAK